MGTKAKSSSAVRTLLRCLLAAAIPLAAMGCESPGKASQGLGDRFRWNVPVKGSAGMAGAGEGQVSVEKCQRLCLPETLCPDGACDLMIDGCRMVGGDPKERSLECTGSYPAEQ